MLRCLFGRLFHPWQSMENLVSIITPTYNCGRYIGAAIDSVLAQTHKDWEMLIVDDCSTDNTSSVVSAYHDPRIRYIRSNERMGAAMTRNAALRMAHGRWIAFLDSDDLWHPEKLERQIRFMEDNGYAFTYHAYREIDEESQPLGVTVSGIRHVSRLAMRCCCWPGCLTVMYDANVIGVVQIANMKKNNDFAIWLRVSQKADCHLLPQVLASYRRRTGSITPESTWVKIKWHYLLFRQSEGCSHIAAGFWTIMNILGNSMKKIFFRQKKRRSAT